MLARLKPDPPVADDYEAALARRREKCAPFESLLEQEKAITVALSLGRNQQDAESDRCEPARRIAGKYYALAKRRPEQLTRKLEEVKYQIEDSVAEYRAEIDRFNEARRAETRRIAESLVPRHRAAVTAIAKAIESLSVAISEERGVHAELARRAPEERSYLLPSMEPPCGSLAEWNSMLSEWARLARKRGFLK